MNKFGFSEAQAEAIVTMQLYRLSSTDVKDLKSEFSRLKKEIRDLEKILKDPNARKELMKAELHRTRRRVCHAAPLAARRRSRRYPSSTKPT